MRQDRGCKERYYSPELGGHAALRLQLPLDRVRRTFREYPRQFWSLVLGTFIDRIGSTLIFPFFTLYVTAKFEVGMTQAGILLALFSLSGFIGGIIGGALTDRFGRRGIILFGLIFSALSSVAMGYVEELSVFYSLAVVVGLLSDVGGPARGAMVADLLPEEQRADGFGVMRVAGNLAWIIGPSIGGILAAHSYLLLFILDAISSLLTALVIYRMVPETLPEGASEKSGGSLQSTIAGYLNVARDQIFVIFVAVSTLMTLVYGQMYSTLSVYLRDVHGVPTQAFGALLSMNAATVVLFQFWVTRRIKAYPPLIMMICGTALYLVGFSMYGFVAAYPLFLAAMLLITFGEMIIIPVGNALVANLSPEDMRGRYMAFFSLSWAVPSMIGPWAAGLVMDFLDPHWVWYGAGLISAVAMVGYALLHRLSQGRLSRPAARLRGANPPP
jgi:MFS family permease